jgi:hypothetical protein
MSQADDAADPVTHVREQFGLATRSNDPAIHQRPDGIRDDTVKALGTLSEALEVVENARGYLYAFHRLSGMADLRLQDAVAELRDAGHAEQADLLAEVIVGRNVVRDMWTFEIVEAYDTQYWWAFREAERTVRASLGVLPPHLYEAEMKQQEQLPGRPQP